MELSSKSYYPTDKKSFLYNKVPISHAFRDFVERVHVGCLELPARDKEESKPCEQHVQGFDEKRSKKKFTLDPANK